MEAISLAGDLTISGRRDNVMVLRTEKGKQTRSEWPGPTLSLCLGMIRLKGKKVLAIDLDLRKASLSEYVESPHRGISTYLSGKEDDYHNLIVQLGNIDILPCGKLPPNPSELLYTAHFEHLMNSVKEEYDYVFVDCPPVEIVADASIVNRFVDQTLFVIRAKLMERTFLPEIEQWYQEKRYKNLSVILNGKTGEAEYSRYGYHRYGYGRGYGYGYGKAVYGKTAYGNDVKES
jgi:capsular exopolysaccharide synthesis family protein